MLPNFSGVSLNDIEFLVELETGFEEVKQIWPSLSREDKLLPLTRQLVHSLGAGHHKIQKKQGEMIHALVAAARNTRDVTFTRSLYSGIVGKFDCLPISFSIALSKVRWRNGGHPAGSWPITQKGELEMPGDTSQKTESIEQLVASIDKEDVVLPEFQRDFVWEEAKTHDLFDSIIRDIFVGSLIFGIPTFEVTVRELDMRTRKGKGSRKKLSLKSFSKDEINERVKTGHFRLLLDGQQRVTSIYRSLKGIDEVWIVTKNDDELPESVRQRNPAERQLEEVLHEVCGRESPERLSIRISDVFDMVKGKILREIGKVDLLGATAFCKNTLPPEQIQESKLFVNYLAYTEKLQSLLRGEKLLAYYLLDTNEEKFALFFERSNSKGIQLNFLDILAAKLYSGFNLRQKIEEFREENQGYFVNGNTIVRAISYMASDRKDIGRQYILSSLTHEHFKEHWDPLCRLYRRSLDYLYDNHFLISQQWLPYENIMIPLIIFLVQLPSCEFTQMNGLQSKFVKFWYWSVIFSQRYSSASLETIVTDADVLGDVARGNYDFGPDYFRRFDYAITSYKDLYTISKKSNAIYRGVLNIMNLYGKGIRDWKNNDNVGFNSAALDDHHVFPASYLRTKFPEFTENLIGCVLNRALIPKITNIQIGSKPPSQYLDKLYKDNNSLPQSLEAHLMTERLITGDYDGDYEVFLGDRGQRVMEFIKSEILDLKAEIGREMFGEELTT